MGHPDRKPKREQRKKQCPKMLSRRNLYSLALDLTPHNTACPMVKGEEFITINYK